MKNNFLILSLLLFATLTACKDTKWIDVPAGTPPAGTVTGKPGESEEPEGPGELYDSKYVHCSYIRTDNLEVPGRIDKTSMHKCNDLIFMECRVYANGDLTFDAPINQAVFTGGIKYLEELDGRPGVLNFDGTGIMKGGDVFTPNGTTPAYTFSTYLYIDEWVDGAYIFKNNDSAGHTNISLQMTGTSAAATFKFMVGPASATTKTPIALPVAKWHRVALTYDKGTVMVYVNATGLAFTAKVGTELPKSTYPATFMLGENFKGSLEETCSVNVVASNFGQTPFIFTSWPYNKAVAYWKYDDATNPGKDSHVWPDRLALVRSMLDNPERKQKLRLGVAGGSWVEMVKNANARQKFAENIKKVLDEYQLDGVDLDFEPGEAAGADGLAYSACVLKLREVLKPDAIISVSLHPIFYGLSQEAIAAVDFNTYQVYGPQTVWWPMNKYIEAANKLINWGWPRSKILMGVPLYATTGTPGEQVAYSSLVYDGALVDTALDQMKYTDGKNYTFNGVQTIGAKTEYVCSQGLGGIMTWDLSTDLPYEHAMSLTRAVQDVFDSHSQKTE